MRILITGNLGYIGPVLTRHLRNKYPDSFIAGFDIGYFQAVSTGTDFLDQLVDIQYYGDVRNFPESILNGYDAVVHLAAISNDPIGNQFEEVTHQINHKASTKIAKMAKVNGVKNFVFASSCSVYGSIGEEARVESSELNPLTAYAKSKVNTENDLLRLASEDFKITCLRFATACGMSPRLRLDLVLNDFVATVLTTKYIKILSDGTPWRPLIHVKDMSLAIDWAISRIGDGFLVVNVGSNSWNYQIRELAEEVSRHFEGARVEVNDAASPDSRSYQVNFSLFKRLAPNFSPKIGLFEAIIDLNEGMKKIDFSDKNFRSNSLIRLNVIKYLLSNGFLNKELYWTRK